MLVGDDVDDLVLIDISGKEAKLQVLCNHKTSWHTSDRPLPSHVELGRQPHPVRFGSWRENQSVSRQAIGKPNSKYQIPNFKSSHAGAQGKASGMAFACTSLLAADKKGRWLMESASMYVKRIYILRIDPGEDVLEAVKRFLKEARLNRPWSWADTAPWPRIISIG